MKIWTVKNDWSGKFLPIVNSSKPQYGGFDYRVSSTCSEGVVVVAECEAALRWLPHMRAGVEDYCAKVHKEGEFFEALQFALHAFTSMKLTQQKVLCSYVAEAFCFT